MILDEVEKAGKRHNGSWRTACCRSWKVETARCLSGPLRGRSTVSRVSYIATCNNELGPAGAVARPVPAAPDPGADNRRSAGPVQGIVADLVRIGQRSGVVSAAPSAEEIDRRRAAMERGLRAPSAGRGEQAGREARRHAEALMEKPLIARAMLAEDFPAAFRLVWESAGSPADVDLTDLKELSGRAPDRMLFGLAREICRQKAVEAVRVGKRDLAEAWRLLSAPPEGNRWRTPEGHWIFSRVLIALARAIDADPTLLDDDRFCEAVVGWKFLDRAGSDGEEDLIVCAKSHGAALKVDKGELRVWAKRQIEEWK